MFKVVDVGFGNWIMKENLVEAEFRKTLSLGSKLYINFGSISTVIGTF